MNDTVRFTLKKIDINPSKGVTVKKPEKGEFITEIRTKSIR